MGLSDRYNSDKVLLVNQGEVTNSLRDIGHYLIVGNDPNLAVSKDSVFINFFEAHLKADNSSTSFENQRNSDLTNFRTFVDNKTNGFNVLGGDFNFNHCHLLGYGNGDDVAPAVGISNYFVDQINAVTNVGSINEGTITNSVIYSNLEHELAIDTIPDVAITLNFNFESNLISSETIFSGPIFDNNNNIWNSDPLFKDVSLDDFTFWSTSPVKDVGDASFPIVLSTPNSDILGNSRSGTPDIGAYEF